MAPITTVWCVLMLEMEDLPLIWRVAANILNKQSGKQARDSSPA